MMTQMVLRRIAIGFATLIVVSVIVFLATNILPGDVAEIVLGQSATPETLAATKSRIGYRSTRVTFDTSHGSVICSLAIWESQKPVGHHSKSDSSRVGLP